MNLNKIFDTIQDFQKVNENSYNYLKNGQPAYQLTKADKHWQCTCPAYKFHHTCKHSEELEQLLKVTTDPDPHHQRHPRAEMEKFIPELTEICKPLDTWCLTDDAILFTQDGPISVGELKSGTFIWDGEKFSEAVVLGTKEVDTLKVIFKTGHVLECSEDHKFLAKGWKDTQVFQQVTKNCQFILNSTPIVFNTKEFSQEIQKKHISRVKLLDLSNLNKKELAYWIGRFFGDGTLSNDEQIAKGNYYVRLAFGKNELQEAERYQKFLQSIGVVASIDEEDTSLTVDVFHKNLQLLFEFYGACRGRAATKRLGKGAYYFSPDERKSLIQGYIDADGYIGKTDTHVTSINRELLCDFQQLCHSVGITTSLCGPYRGGLRKVCGIICDTKPEYHLSFRKKGKTTTVRSIEHSHNKVTVISILDKKHQYYSSGFISKNCIVGSWRRKSPTFKDVDVIALATPEAWKQVRENLKASGAWQEDIFGDTLMRGIYHGYYLDFNLCPDQEHWLWWLIYRTGSSDENVALRRRAISMGYGISENGVQDRFSFDYYPNDQIHSEEDFYHFFGYEYRPPEQRDGKNFKELLNFNIEEHYSEGLKQKLAGDVDWSDYLLESMKKVKGNVYSSAKYPLRKAILVAKEIARRWDRPVEEILRVVDPLTIQPEGPKKGQQTWDKDGHIIKAEEDYNQTTLHDSKRTLEQFKSDLASVIEVPEDWIVKQKDYIDEETSAVEPYFVIILPPNTEYPMDPVIEALASKGWVFYNSDTQYGQTSYLFEL